MDTSGLLALFNRTEPTHEAVRSIVAVLEELAGGAYELACLDAAELERASEVIERYRDQAIAIADASIVVLADRYRARRILTLDHHRFGVVRPLSGGRFSLVP